MEEINQEIGLTAILQGEAGAGGSDHGADVKEKMEKTEAQV